MRLNKNSIFIFLFFLINTVVIYYAIFMSKSIITGWDTQFHLNRIEELAMSFRGGHITPSTGTFAFKQIGLNVNSFYPYLFLYPFAFLRNIFNPITSYNFMLSIVTLLSFCLSNFSVKKITGSKRTAFWFSIFYNNSAYLILQFTQRGDIAEYIALVFLPLVIAGIISIMKDEAGYSWIYLPVAMSAVIYAHLLSGIIFSLFLLFLLLISFNYIVSFKNLIQKLSLSVLGVIIAVSPILFGIIKITSNTQVVSPIVPQTLDKEALYLNRIVDLSIGNNLPMHLHDINLGALILICGIVGLLNFKGKDSIFAKFEVLGLMSLLLSTNVIAWNYFKDSIFSILQFPWRFMGIATFCFAIAAAHVVSKFKNNKNLLIFIGTLIMSFNLVNQYLSNNDDSRRIYANQVEKYNDISKNAIYTDYMPDKAFISDNRIRDFRAPSYIHNHEVSINGNKFLLSNSQIKSDYNQITYRVNHLKKGKKNIVILPLLNYGLNYSDNNKIKVKKSKIDTTTVEFVSNETIKNITIKIIH